MGTSSFAGAVKADPGVLDLLRVSTYMLGLVSFVASIISGKPHNMISSTALPKVTFIKAPMVSPRSLAICSVA